MKLTKSHILLAAASGTACLSAFLVAIPAQAQGAPTVAAASANVGSSYRLGVNDRVTISIYGEDDMSREYTVSPEGKISLALIGDVVAKGRTAAELKADIQHRLSDGYLKKPAITVEITGFRNFYILGEVNKPGEFPYVSGLTLTQAVAAASGYTYRAAKRYVYIRHEGEDKETRVQLKPDMLVQPGDTIRLGERYF